MWWLGGIWELHISWAAELWAVRSFKGHVRYYFHLLLKMWQKLELGDLKMGISLGELSALSNSTRVFSISKVKVER